MDGKSSAPLRIYLSPSDKVEKKKQDHIHLKIILRNMHPSSVQGNHVAKSQAI